MRNVLAAIHNIASHLEENGFVWRLGSQDYKRIKSSEDHGADRERRGEEVLEKQS